MRLLARSLALVSVLTAIGACRKGPSDVVSVEKPVPVSAFLEEANATLLKLGAAASQASWVQATYMTSDTEAILARATEAYTTASTEYAKRAATYSSSDATADEKRQLTVLKNVLVLAAPADPKETTELSEIHADLKATFARARWCPNGSSSSGCMERRDVAKELATLRDERRARELWEGWHTIGPQMKKPYVRFVELSNKGARQLGFADTGAMWRSRYDMPPEAFGKELDRLWEQLKPLYLSLHAYVRTKLHEKYGAAVSADGPIPAHLLGNLWAQDWTNIYDLVAPPTGSGQRVPLDEILKRRKVSPVAMVKYGEKFFVSLGFEPLPETFWQRSMFEKPKDREVACQATADVIDGDSDVRFRLCAEPTADHFRTIHHELGHDFYYRAYRSQPYVLRDGPNDGFHEALGDTMTLSLTPDYFVKIGLVDAASKPGDDIGFLLDRALNDLAFLPFGLVVDKWRWQVFSGETTPDHYNSAWWSLREHYQGVRPSSQRGEEFFDAATRSHIPDNMPYARYFVASVLTYQFHRGLSKVAGCAVPLHQCSIYGNKAAGDRLQRAMALGASKPWPDVLEALTGERQMDAGAVAEYFAPLKRWLDQQNKVNKSGW